MNSLIKYLAGLTFIAISACDPSDTLIYFVENQTDENYELAFYESGVADEKFEIPENSKTKIFESSALSPEIPNWDTYDSIVFVSSSKRIVYKNNDDDKTFYNYDYWEQKTETTRRNGSTDVFTFILSEEDLN